MVIKITIKRTILAFPKIVIPTEPLSAFSKRIKNVRTDKYPVINTISDMSVVFEVVVIGKV